MISPATLSPEERGDEPTKETFVVGEQVDCVISQGNKTRDTNSPQHGEQVVPHFQHPNVPSDTL